jgi:hypothetical protein
VGQKLGVIIDQTEERLELTFILLSVGYGLDLLSGRLKSMSRYTVPQILYLWEHEFTLLAR